MLVFAPTFASFGLQRIGAGQAYVRHRKKDWRRISSAGTALSSLAPSTPSTCRWELQWILPADCGRSTQEFVSIAAPTTSPAVNKDPTKRIKVYHHALE